MAKGFYKTLTNRITNGDNLKSVGSKFRAKRIIPLMKIIEEVSQVHDHVNIIDVGEQSFIGRFFRKITLKYTTSVSL